MNRGAILLGVTLGLAVPAAAAPASVPANPAAPASPLVSLSVLPPEVVIDRPQATQQLLVMGRRADGSLSDLTAQARFASSLPASAPVSPTGTVSALRNGVARVRVSLPSTRLQAAVPVTVRNAGGPYRWDFVRQIAPVLARGGCSGASCHGATAGRGGFKLSFFGQDPDQDYEALARASEGRRVNRMNPGASLVLLKPTLTLPHGGGRRFKPGSPEYRALARWIAGGALRGGDPARVERLEVLPAERLLTRPGETQRLLVTAYFSDGTREDVSEQALFESKNEGAVTVDGSRVLFAGLGEAPVLARYGGQVAAANVTATSLPPLRAFPAYDATHVVDREIFGKLKRLRVPPAEAASDHEFVRRVTLDLAGRIPTAAETERFCANTDPGKREALVDALLNGPEFPKHWRDNLNVLLMGRTAFPMAPAWAAWLETSLKEDRGWDQMARELLLARPEKPEQNGALYFLDSRFAQGDTGLDVATRDVSRIFFGVDIQCARCHTHPDVAAWQQQAYWGIAAFLGRSYRIQVNGASYLGEKATGEVQYFGPDKNLRAAAPVFLTGESAQEPAVPAAAPATPESPDLYTVAPEEAKEKTRVPVPKYSRRRRLVEIAVGAQDPYFKRAVVNRVWALLMGRGLVEPVDQMHLGNPPSHPLLLQELSEEFARNGFSLKRLVRTLVTSQAYARSSQWKPAGRLLAGRPPAELYAVAAARPQSMHQLANSMLVAAGYGAQAAGSPGPEADASADAGKARAQFEAQFAAQLAEIRRRLDSGTETFQPNVAQALYLSNSRAFQQLLEQGGLAARLAKLPDDGEAVRQAYLAVLSRPPDAEELAAFRQYLDARKDRRPAAVVQVVWVLVTSAEFRFIH
jgi:hypothetical protein